MGSKEQVEVNILELFKVDLYSVILSERGSSFVNERSVLITCDFELYFLFLAHLILIP
jgi:hypothetical protein